MSLPHDRNALAARLLALPKAILDAELQVASCQLSATNYEASFILGSGLDGAKNDTERKARIAAWTAQAEFDLATLKAELGCLRNEHSSLRAIARLIGGTDD